MKTAERKAYRPTTVRNNILGCIRALRATRKQLETMPRQQAMMPGGVHSYATQLESKIKTLLNERKENNWTN